MMRYIAGIFLFFLFISCSSLDFSMGKDISYIEFTALTQDDSFFENLEIWAVPPFYQSIMNSPDLMESSSEISYHWPRPVQVVKVIPEVRGNTPVANPTPTPPVNNSPPVTPSSPVNPSPAPAVVAPPSPVVTPTMENTPSTTVMDDHEEDVEFIELEAQGGQWIIELDGGGWEFLNHREDGYKAQLLSRNQDTRKTRFHFDELEAGDYLLVFSKQDHQRGGQREIFYRVKVNSPILEDNPVEEGEDTSPMDENPESLVEELNLVEGDHSQTEKSIELLERILRYRWNDEDMAGFYYRLAQQLERNGVTQDLRRSYELYELIQQEFFLSSYYDLAGERILFLDRHYLRLH